MVLEQQPDHRGGPHHVVSVFAKRVFFFFFLPQLDAGEPEQRQLSSRGAIDPPSPQLGLLSSEKGDEEEGETECRAAGYQQQRELKQRFLINPENVESKSSAHVVKISQG